MEAYIVGIDLAKEVFHLHGADRQGRRLWVRRLKREELLPFMASLSRCRVAMEACGGAHHWGRVFSQQGHQVLIIAAQYVAPFVKRNKNDRHDACAIVEAALRPEMRFVGIKSVDQQEVQSLHRVRSRLVSDRTAVIQEIRGFLLEFGIAVKTKVSNFKKLVPGILEEDDNGLTFGMREILQDLFSEYLALDEKVKSYGERIERVCDRTAVCRALLARPGFGVLTATALYAEVGDPRVYKNGRNFSASLGLVPKHRGTGGRVRLQGISRRGNSYLRQLMVHGARSVVSKIKMKVKSYEHGDWVKRIEEERGFNKACVALANKNARWAWHILSGH